MCNRKPLTNRVTVPTSLDDRHQNLPRFAQGTIDDPQLTAALKVLELSIRRRLDGVLQGNYTGLIPGPGTEPGDARTYQPGDDVRRMDWSVTARTNEAHVRQMVADRELETWLAVDLSPSLDFGTTGGEKRDLAIAAAASISYITMGGGNRIGAVIATGDTVKRLPARGGRQAAQVLLKTIATTPRAPEGTRGDLRGTLELLRRPQRRRGLVVVISDFLGPIDWERSLRALAARHEVLGIEVLDPRDLQLPDVGDVTLRDVETSDVREVSITPQLRRDFAQAAREHQACVHKVFRSNDSAVVTLRTDRDWISDLVRYVARRRQGATAG